jgi:hypothetical protein
MSFNYDEAVDSWGQRTRSRTRAHGRLSMAVARCAPVFTVLIRVRFPNVGNLHIHTSSVAHSSAACANLGVRALARFRFVRTSRLQTIAEQVARDRAVTFACMAYGLLFLMRPTRAPFVRGALVTTTALHRQRHDEVPPSSSRPAWTALVEHWDARDGERFHVVCFHLLTACTACHWLWLRGKSRPSRSAALLCPAASPAVCHASVKKIRSGLGARERTDFTAAPQIEIFSVAISQNGTAKP